MGRAFIRRCDTLWTNISHDLAEAAETEIPVCYFTQETDSSNDQVLHIFTDSNMKAYGACAYIVSGSESSLVMARNRVALLRQKTIPKLEHGRCNRRQTL